jgi:hypothetical protein
MERPAPATSVLVATCEAYRPMAEVTAGLVARHWPGHPPLFFCGVAGGPGEAWLPRRDDPADWMGILRAAVDDLEERGYVQSYLILEDHPPLFRCREEHLNRALPLLLARLDAAYIGLNGWGQGKPRRGPVLGPDALWLEQVAPSFPWKFQLHPALWRLRALRAILDRLIPALSLDQRTAWAFERRGGALGDEDLPGGLARRAYRVCGHRTSASPARSALVRLARLAAVGVRALTGRVAGDRARRGVEEALQAVLGFYDGPYPLFRSGVLVKGQLNPHLVRFLRLSGRAALARRLAAAAVGPSRAAARAR